MLNYRQSIIDSLVDSDVAHCEANVRQTLCLLAMELGMDVVILWDHHPDKGTVAESWPPRHPGMDGDNALLKALEKVQAPVLVSDADAMDTSVELIRDVHAELERLGMLAALATSVRSNGNKPRFTICALSVAPKAFDEEHEVDLQWAGLLIDRAKRLAELQQEQKQRLSKCPSTHREKGRANGAPLTKEYVADMLGLTVRTISRRKLLNGSTMKVGGRNVYRWTDVKRLLKVRDD